ncbi:MAG: SpoIIE family protein phosphatase [Leptospirales bacterium]|nr:SpoIIE family protein phosphatase [Leptospirales bacterium]
MNGAWKQRLRPGIRGKLSLFIALMLGGLIAAFLAAAVRQQNDALAAKAQQEVARYLTPVELLTLEVDHVAAMMTALERLRRSAEQAKTRGTESAFFSAAAVKEAEERIRDLIRPSPSSDPVDERRFSYLQGLARRVMDASPEKTGYALPRKLFEEELRASFEYNSRIAVAFRGLDLRRYRAESIDLYRWPRFDTAQLLSERQRRSAPIDNFLWGRSDELRVSLDALYRPYIQSRRPQLQAAPADLTIDGGSYLLVSRTFFRHPELSRRAELCLRNLPHSAIWRRYVEREKTINAQLKLAGLQWQARTATLLSENSDRPPAMDSEWRSLRDAYQQLRTQRDEQFNAAAKSYLQREDANFASAAPDEQPEELPAAATIVDALRYLRAARLERDIGFHWNADIETYDDYLRGSRARSIGARRLQLVLDWVLAGRSPLNAPGYSGLQTLTRQQAEARLIAIDTQALDDLALDSLYQETAGFTRILADRRAYQQELGRERSRFVDTALSIALRFLFLTFLLSHFFVGAVRGIIRGAARVGRGDLSVRFQYRSADELGQLADSLNSMVQGLKEREELRGELSAAEEIQKRLIPESPPQGFESDLSFGSYYKSMIGVGGDYFDFIVAGKREFVFCVADVSSHGVGPAIVMTMLRAQLHSIVRRGERDLLQILQELNRRAYADTPENIFITMCLGRYRADSGDIEYVSCGHLPPLLLHYKDGSVERLKAGGIPVGALDNELFADMVQLSATRLSPGDLFFLYTDGLTEAMNANDELYGEPRLLTVLGASSRKKPAVLVQLIAEDIEAFSGKSLSGKGPSGLNDDVAMIAFRRLR